MNDDEDDGGADNSIQFQKVSDLKSFQTICF